MGNGIYAHQEWMWNAYKEIIKDKIKNWKMNKYELGWVPEIWIIKIKEEIEAKKNENRNEKENSKDKNLKPISVNKNNIELGKKSPYANKTKKMNMNKILNVNNYQINNTWNNTFNNIENKKGINNENITMNNNQIFDNFNNYIINCIPMNNNNNKKQEKKENNIIIRRKIISENKNGININNLLISNNINIENKLINNNGNDDILKSENIGNKKINRINQNKINNQKNNKNLLFTDNKIVTTHKRMNLSNNNLPFNNEKKLSENPEKTGNKSEITNLNNNRNNRMNKSNITEIKYDNKTKKIINSKFNFDNKNDTYKQNSKKNIMLNESKCNSQKNINSPKSMNIITSPVSQKMPNTRKRIIVKKDNNNKTNKNQNNKIILNPLNIKNAKSSMSQDEIIDNKYLNIMKPKEKELGNHLIKKKYLNQKNSYNNYNNNTYISNKDDLLNKKIDISIIEKNSTYSKRYDNRLKVLTQGIKESFCYFKIITNNDTVKFDPLDNCSSAPENFGYIDGYISIDIEQHKFKIISKMSKNSNFLIEDLLNKDISFSDSNLNEEENEKNKSFICIELKDIVDVIITYEMKNIIRIFNAYNKYSNGQENVNINRFIYSREINDIPMEHNERIKAAFCNFFMFYIILGKKSISKIEFIFINFDQFNLWYNCLQYITKINNQSPTIISSKTYNSNGSFDKNKK